MVIHLAAITDAEYSIKNKDIVEHNNIESTKRIAKYCSSNKSKLIYISSTSVYGTQDNYVDEDCDEIDLKPQSPYAVSKLKEEKLLQNITGEEKFPFTICRFGTIYGTSPGIRFHTAVNKFCWQAVMNQPLTIWKTALNQKRPYLSLVDACRALGHIIRHHLFDTGIYNIVTENLTVESILNIIRKFIPNIRIDYIDSPIMNQLSYEVSNKKFRDTGFIYRGSIEKNIDETIKLLKNSNSLFL